jgi:hypothetical protein
MKNGDSGVYVDRTRHNQNNETVYCPRRARRSVKVCDGSLRKAIVLVFLLPLLAIVAPTAALHAQVSGATLTGTVTDPSGAVIPNAELSIQNVATGTARQLTTDSAGIYTAPNLPPGTYEVTVAAAGFQTAMRRGLTLTVGAQQLLNFSMKIGGNTQQVEVTTGTLGVELASSEISGVVTQKTVVELPLNGRDWTQLATLQPGVDSLGSVQTDAGTKDRARRGYGVELSISGSRPSQQNYRIDGISVNDYANTGPGSVEGATLGVDAVQEFSVLTSNYAAEYGRTSGGVINAVTKSGANDLHGNLYEFFRNKVLDAANFIDNANGTPKPNFVRNQFGGSLGGPIKKDRTFFFADYEGLRQSQGITIQTFVPSAAIRGIGTGPNGGPGPSTVCSIPQPGCTTMTLSQFLATPGPNGQQRPQVQHPDPVTGIDSAVVPYLGLWQLPNAGLIGNGDQGIYAFNSGQLTAENFGNIRIDHKFSDKDSISGTYQNDQAIATQPDANNDVRVDNLTGRQLISIEETHIFSPQLINSARFGLNRSVHTGGGVSAINPLASNLALGENPGADNPQVDILSGGYTSIQPGLNQVEVVNFFQNSWQGYDDLFLTKGIHSLKFGFAVENIITLTANPAPAGDVQFSSLYEDPVNGGFLTNNPLSLNGPVNTVFPQLDFHTTIFGGYAQDDIRLRPTLTLNLGLRYETSTVPNEVNGRLSALSSPFNQTAPFIGNTVFQNPTHRDFEPRVGFAWDPLGSGKTSVRGGFGLFDVLPLAYEFGQFATNAAPFIQNGLVSTTSATNPLVQGDFPTNAFNKLAANVAAGLSERFPYVENKPKRSYVLQWNLSVQRELSPNLTATIAYVGSRGIHQLFRADDVNVPLPTQTSAGYVFPLPTFNPSTNTFVPPPKLSPAIGQIDTLQWGNDSFYHGLEVQVNKKLSRGFQVGGSYTWSRAIDGGDGSIASDSFVNSIPNLFFFLPRTRRGPADFNVTQNVTVNFLWLIPTPLHGLVGTATRGWQIGGIFTGRTGLPFTPLIGGDPLGLGNAGPFDYPNRLSGPGCDSLVNPGNVTNYIKIQCFGLPQATPAIASQCTAFATAPGTCTNLLGNAGRNVINGPGLADFDFSLIKETKINERFGLEFRAEFFNIINHANFNAPILNSAIFNPDGSIPASAGQITSTSTSAREIQFGLKLGF